MTVNHRETIIATFQLSRSLVLWKETPVYLRRAVVSPNAETCAVQLHVVVQKVTLASRQIADPSVQ